MQKRRKFRLSGLSPLVHRWYLFRIENGYAYTFSYSGPMSGPYYEDFEALISSAEYPAANPSATFGSGSNTGSVKEFNLNNIIFSLIVTILVYSLPIIIYRYAVHAAPVAPKKAKMITCVYGFFAFIVMSLLLLSLGGSGAAGGAIVFWSWVNYRILIGGEVQAENAEPCSPPGEPVCYDDAPDIREPASLNVSASPEQTAAEAPADGGQGANFCHNCGAKLSPDGNFCHNCGTRIRP